MTAKQVLKEWLIQVDQTPFKEGHFLVIEEAIKEYTKLKCAELLEIVAERVSKMEATIYVNPTAPRYARVDKNSILNAVNLEEFIK